MYQKKHKQFPNIKVHDALNLGIAPSYMNISGSGVVDSDDRTSTSQTPAESLAALTGTDMSEEASENNSGAGSAAGAGITGAGGSGVA